METDGQWDPRKCGRAMVSQQRANKLFFRQVTRNQKREWRDLPWAQWQYRDGLRSMGQLSTGQRPQFKIALTHLLIILILSFPEARGAYQGCPSDISAWSPLHQDLHVLQLHATMFSPDTSPWAASIHHTSSSQEQHQPLHQKSLAPQAELGSHRGGSGRHPINTQVAKRSLSPKRIWGHCLQLECCWQVY